jgi:arylsulfatase A-like enzyme
MTQRVDTAPAPPIKSGPTPAFRSILPGALLLCLAVLSCGGRPIHLWRLYQPGRLELRRMGPAAAIRIVGDETLSPRQATMGGDGNRWVSRGTLSLSESRFLGAARVLAADGLVHNASHISVTLTASGPTGERSAIAVQAPVDRGTGVWAPVRLPAGQYSWSVDVSLKAPAGRARAPHEIALVWVETGDAGLHDLQAEGETRPGLLLTEGSDVLCELPDGGRWFLETGVALPPLSRSPGHLDVILQADEPRRLATLVANGAEWRDVLFELPTLGPRSRLSLRCLSGEVFLGAPILVPESARSARLPNILLISLDTVRADHLDPWGGPGLTPELTSFAARSVVFERTVAQAPVTRESHQSIMTGLQVPKHAGHEHWVLPEGIPTLASRLADAGYRTAAFTDGGMVSAAFGFSRGFERYAEYSADVRVKPHVRAIFDQCLSWVQRTEGPNPWFAFVHTYEAHSPYKDHEDQSSPPLLVRWDREPASLESLAEKIIPLGASPRWSPDRLLDMAKHHYASEVRYLDGALAGFLRSLEQEGLLENTLVVVLSDHGEGFFEHGLVSHGNSVYEELIEVPLLLHFPGGEYAGTRVRGVVQTVDLFPTVLDFLELPPSDETDGASLLPACRSGRAERRPALSADPQLFSVTLWPWKLIVPRDGKPCVLYGLDADPGETRDVLADAQPALVDSLVAPLVELLVSAHRGYLIEIDRPDHPGAGLILSGGGVSHYHPLFVAPGDQIRTSEDELAFDLSASPLGTLAVLLPRGPLPAARAGEVEGVGLTEGVCRVGEYSLIVTRCRGEPLEEPSSGGTELSADLAARLRALGYVD